MAAVWKWSLFLGILTLLHPSMPESTSTDSVTIRGKTYGSCNMVELDNNFLHVVTCHGYIRFPMRGHSVASMNAAIDRILEGSQHVNANSSCPQIKMFYYNASAIMFMRYPDFEKTGEVEYDDSVAYWIGNLEDKECRFNPFPPKSQWTVLGRGFNQTEFEKLTNQEKLEKKAMCKPRTWFYNLHRNLFLSFPEHSVDSQNLTHSGEGRMKCPRYDDPLQEDPIKCKVLKENCDQQRVNYGNNVRSFINQIYEGHYIFSKFSVNNIMVAVFRRMELTLVKDYINGQLNWYDLLNVNEDHCFLRRYREDLGEQLQVYMLPDSG